MLRESTWVESVQFWKNDFRVVIEFRDLAPWAPDRGSIWYDLLILEKEKEFKRIGGLAPFDCKSACILEEELILLEKLTEMGLFMSGFVSFDFKELATYIASYINIFILTEGKAGQLAFPEKMSDGWEAVWNENTDYEFETRWDVVPVEVEEGEETEVEDDLI